MRVLPSALKPFGAASVLTILIAAPAAAQSPASEVPRRDTPAGEWTVTAGYESLAFRDVSRNIRPVDASPVAWHGQGPTAVARYDRAGDRMLHRVSLAFARAGGFTYRSPTRTDEAAPGDRASRIDARYEYRRYPLTNVVFDGLDLGLGVQGIGARVSLTRHLAPALEAQVRHYDAGVGVVAAARYRAGRAFALEAAWTNGGVVSRRHAHHSADVLSSVNGWGAGWLTDLSLSARVPLWRATALSVTWLRTGEGFGTNHYSYVVGRQSIVAGVGYAR